MAERPRPSPLAGLLAHLAGGAQALAEQDPALAGHKAAYPELPLLDEFRLALTRASAGRQLRQSQEKVPENAGPLNSSHLVHRSLTLMRLCSPGYLHAFLGYADTLAWLERLQDGAAGQGAAGPGASGAGSGQAGRKPARGKGR
ncbi:DUF2894 domain-containing protein [Orrella sp. JC864]|uniref:DUF2894 domain-containing protein n=1 Tax=Orrella sp. JC864 TaxID=3120298 RepID=UPI003FA7600D